MSLTTRLYDAWHNLSELRREQRRHRDTIAAVGQLPPHILKDIGWPGGYERQRKVRSSW